MKKIKDLICKYFGCTDMYEMYAVKSQNNKYMVVEECFCTRCGKRSKQILDQNLSRVELLERKWFFEKSFN